MGLATNNTVYHTQGSQEGASRSLAPEKKARANFGITEILMAYGEDLSMVLPMLASISQQNEKKGLWLTWVVPKSFDSRLLKQYGFDTKHIRIIQSEHRDDSLWLTWEALNNGNSGYVVTVLDGMTDTERSKLEQASTSGNTRGLVLSSR